MDKKLLERLIIIADNLRILAGNLYRIHCTYPYAVGKDIPIRLGIEIDCLDAIIDYLKATNEGESK